MSEHENLCSIYEQLYKTIDSFPKELQDGADEILYVLQVQLKKLPGINLHIDNFNLRKQLGKLDSYKIRIQALENNNVKLKAENKQINQERHQLTEMNFTLKSRNSDLMNQLKSKSATIET